MKVIKRNGSEVEFDQQKIFHAIKKASDAAQVAQEKLTDAQITDITEYVVFKCQKLGRAVTVEEIQDMVENQIMATGHFELARSYVRYRYQRELARKSNTTDDAILSLVEHDNEELKQENSNKNPMIASTQRDYIAGEVSKDLTMRVLLPKDVVEEHKSGAAHFHDADYFLQHIHNCDLINLEDMLQNGTVITGTQIVKPHSLATAANVATQIVAQVASNQYGGQTFTLSHLAPFVDVSRQKAMNQIRTEGKEFGVAYTDEQVKQIAEVRVKREIAAAIQTIQYQLVTLMTTNGQTPFVSMCLYLDEVPEGRTRDDLAMLIEEVFKQRIQGLPNEEGHFVTPAFPKLLYILDEDNIHPDSKYWYLTELAAKCIAKRMVPDCISAKIMRELKGDVYPCMGCVDGNEVITYKLFGLLYMESFKRMWQRLSDHYTIKLQPNGKDFYMDTPDVEIFDQVKGFVKNKRIIKNANSRWMKLTFSNGRLLTCTPDHPFETENRGVVYAKDLNKDDIIKMDGESMFIDAGQPYNTDRAWLYGFLLCDATYYDNIVASIANEGEDDIGEKFSDVMLKEFGLQTRIVSRDRGVKGQYKDLKVLSDGTEQLVSLKAKLTYLFNGKAKVNRHVPNEVFRWNRFARIHFLAGMIDADGYINNSNTITTVQIGSTNKELALQQMILAQTLGMKAHVYANHYRSNNKNCIRYRVEFVPTGELLSAVVCKKKTCRDVQLERNNSGCRLINEIHLSKSEEVLKDGFSYDVTTESEHFTVSGIYSHNCRSFLTPDRFTDAGIGNIANAKNYVPGKHKYYGRFNQGVYTLNLVDIACASGKDEKKFWEIFDQKLAIAHKALRCRHERLKGTLSDTAPILWQYGGIARLKKGETIDKLLYNGYSTISLGYAGLYECCKYMTGKSHTDEEAKPFAIAVMQKLNDACNQWKKEENIDYSLYGTPLESTTYKFAKALQKKYGMIPDITDHGYITNSYHVNVREKINAFDKLKFEAEFQKLSPGGCISYVEVPNMQDNIPAVISVMQFIYDNIMYAELNTKSDYCQVCGYDGEIQIVEEDGKLIWKCPHCGNTDQSKMNVARRTCGYIGTQFWNQGRTQEIRDRVLHL